MHIPYGKQHITPADIDAVVAALQHDFLTQGPSIDAFEAAFAEYIGAPYAVAVSNGTAALHLAAMALNVGPGTRVLTSPITFAASANCIRYCGGEVDFVDIDPSTFLMDLDKLRMKLEEAGNGYYHGVIPVDLAGNPVDMAELRAIADEFGLWILEDACHAPGGWFTDEAGKVHRCGDSTLAELAIFSFHPVKHIASGEGGMITTADKDLYEKMRILRTHGITRNPDLMHENHGGWYYEMQELGYNYRLTDIQAALGLSQLQRADAGMERRQAIADRYDAAFADLPIHLPLRQPDSLHAFHLYIILTDQRKDLYDFLRNKGIFPQVHYIPVHLQPYYQSLGFHHGQFPIAEHYYNHCLSLPMFPSLTEEEQSYVIEQVRTFFRHS